MLDEIEISVIAGHGGNGIVSFRRERYVPRGGPDGGDGGKGGAVILRATGSLLGLDALRKKRNVRAEAGGDGGPSKRRGRNGADVVVAVPVGTIVWDLDGKQVADLDEDGESLVIAKGGGGGRGNGRFATSVRRTPRIAEKGLPGEQRRLRLELRLVAEVGLVGLPNAGKSSLLRAMTGAKVKVGAYPFTTLEPELGVAELDYETVVIGEVPGLIEGAHEGAGLGEMFLRHVGRTRLLVHVVDTSAPDPAADVDTVRNELAAYGKGLVEKRWLVALNKMDLPDAAGCADEVERALRARPAGIFRVSAQTGEGVDELLRALFQAVREERAVQAAAPPAEPPTVLPDAPRYEVVRTNRGFSVRGRGPVEAVLKLGTESEEARAELARRLRRMGVVGALRKAGVREGDRVRIGRVELEWPL
ncbi:MAG: GTPase ObgE [Dehalococcoidia bacterium]